jgi:hypothetical protein
MLYFTKSVSLRRTQATTLGAPFAQLVTLLKV